MTAVTPFRHLTPVTGPAPYAELTADLESLAVRYACTDDQFYLAIGQYLEPEALRDEQARTLLVSARQLAVSGVPLSAPAVLAQAHQRVYARTMTPEDYGRLEGWLATTESLAGQTQAQAVADLTTPLIRRRLRTGLIQRLTAANLSGDERQLDELSSQLAQVGNIGRPAAHGWSGLSPGIWELFQRLRRTERATTGLPELDDLLDGGPPRGTITTWGADPGDGKSVAMNTQMVANLLLGRRCVFLSAEMGVPQCLLRTVACLTHEVQGSVARGEARVQAKLASVLEQPTLGAFAIAFIPSGSTVGGVQRALDELAQRDPRFAQGWDHLWVDYGDLLAGNPQDRSSYEEARTVWRGLRRLAEETPEHEARWVTTASQLKDKDQRNGGPNDLADSKHKGRISDLVLLIDRDKDCPDERYVRVAKFRDGRNGDQVGPFTPDFARGDFGGEAYARETDL